MAMDLLRLLAACPLPAICRSAEEIDAVRMLRAAGLVVALTPQDDVSHPQSAGDHAVVLSITPKGFEELQALAFPFSLKSTPENGGPSPLRTASSPRSVALH